MERSIKQIIARKIVERKQPYATGMEVYKMTGKGLEQQRDEARGLVDKGVISMGRTFNDVYYKTKEQW